MKTFVLDSDRQIFSVSEMTRNIRFLLEENFSTVWVEGEVSNFKWHSSGHMYFSLKDEESQIPCVMFKRENAQLGFELKDGLKVIAGGRISVFSPRGAYQLYIDRVEPKGLGALQLKFQELKERLNKEGLFDASRKKPIPFLPRRIGLVTSADGAALRDIMHVIDRRFQGAHLVLYPVPVQGAGAAESIGEAIEDFNRWAAADVLIVGRGGGSLEDLWAFNEEVVARAIFASQIPVISAVGHEVDFTIADFVADLRAATPSAAAEIVLPLKEDILMTVESFKARALQALLARLQHWRDQLDRSVSSRALKDPLAIFQIQRQRLDEFKKTIMMLWANLLVIRKERINALLGKLEVLGPLETLKRGFSVTLRLPSEDLVSVADQLKRGEKIKTVLQKGYLISTVEEIHV